MEYDVLIIGAGICGASIMYELSKYSLKVIAIEAENDVAMGTTRANSGIVHAGYDPASGSMMSKMNVEGSKLIKDICRRLDVPYKQTGSIVVGFDDDDAKTIEKLHERGVKNGVEDMKILNGDEVRGIEPNLSKEITCGLLANTAAVVSPWELCLALAETAVKNGVELKLDSKVTNIKRLENGYLVIAGGKEYSAKFIINSAGVYCEDIEKMIGECDYETIPVRGEYYLLDHSEQDLVKRVIFQCPNNGGKGVLVAPTAHGNIIIGPNSIECGKDETQTTIKGLSYVKKMAIKSVPSINFRENIRNFAGIRSNTDFDDFIIAESKQNKGFINVAGIKSPGLSSAPAIAVNVVGILKDAGLRLEVKENIIDNRSVTHFKEMSHEEREKLIKKDKRFAKVVCRCETITEGEIAESLLSPIPPTSIDGVKRRCGSGMGRCQGGFCSPRVHAILAEHYKLPLEDILLNQEGSFILTGKTKAGDRNA